MLIDELQPLLPSLLALLQDRGLSSTSNAPCVCAAAPPAAAASAAGAT
jgi:hypothetical protein